MLKDILDWSEVWAPLIPLTILLIRKNQPSYLKPVKYYVIFALVINTIGNIIWDYKEVWNFPQWLQSNNFLYNFHSIVRLLLFTWFFILLKQPFLETIKKVVPVLFMVFVIVNFTFFEDFFYYWSFSGRLLSLATGILLLYCLQYYFFILTEENSPDSRPASFWVVTGLSIYVVINFPIFLFYMAFLKQFEGFAINIWDVTNISYILFFLLIAKAFYGPKH